MAPFLRKKFLFVGDSLLPFFSGGGGRRKNSVLPSGEKGGVLLALFQDPVPFPLEKGGFLLTPPLWGEKALRKRVWGGFSPSGGGRPWRGVLSQGGGN